MINAIMNVYGTYNASVYNNNSYNANTASISVILRQRLMQP